MIPKQTQHLSVNVEDLLPTMPVAEITERIEAERREFQRRRQVSRDWYSSPTDSLTESIGGDGGHRHIDGSRKKTTYYIVGTAALDRATIELFVLSAVARAEKPSGPKIDIAVSVAEAADGENAESGSTGVRIAVTAAMVDQASNAFDEQAIHSLSAVIDALVQRAFSADIPEQIGRRHLVFPDAGGPGGAAESPC